jgi:hypothetical protein
MGSAYEHARKAAYHVMLPADAVLSEIVDVGQYMLPMEKPPRISTRSTVRARRNGLIDAVAGWFDATLAPGVHITNAPGAADRLARRDVLLPVHEPIPVSEGDAITIALDVLTTDHVYRWTVERRDANGSVQAFSGSTFEGVLMSRDGLSAREVDARPAATADGLALSLILHLSNGKHSISEIERAVASTHPERFPDSAGASAFVADVLSRYAR